MDKITDKIACLPPSANYFSLEFFPPKTEAGFSNLQTRLARMAYALRPLFVTVTWGAGGSTATKSLELAEVCQRQLGLTTCLHLTCTNMSRPLVDQAVNEAKALGVRNILALRGDPPRSGEYQMDHGQEDSNKDFTRAVDLVRYLREVHGGYFCIGVAGYPEGHADESHPEHQSVEQDLPYLIDKIKAGADFIMTQVVYDVDAFIRYEKTLRSHPSGILASIPIIPGLMPIQSYQVVKRITHLSHARLPPEIACRMESIKSDDEAVKREGVDILSEMVDRIQKLPQQPSLPRGFHFYTLNLEKSVASILDRCDLISLSSSPRVTPATDSISASAVVNVTDGLNMTTKAAQTPLKPQLSPKCVSSIDTQPEIDSEANDTVLANNQAKAGEHTGTGASQSPEARHAPAESAGVTGVPSSQASILLKSEGQDPLGREATWDDYPNGRWGPSNSPAFGDIDGYGPSLKVGLATARQLWNHPKSRADITTLFKNHVEGGLVCVPWSDEGDITKGGALQAETQTIKGRLLGLIEERGFWTLASQPAVNGVKSDDPVFGWGPPGEGLVYQKAFIEFFVPRQSWEGELKDQLVAHGEDEIAWLKTDSSGNFESSHTLKSHADSTMSGAGTEPSGVNVVTWGVFEGKGTVTPTIIEEQSFRAWSEEAYGIWEEWRRVFPRGSEEEKFLESCRRESVLVNVVGQQYVGKGADRLWEILRGD